MFKTLNVNYLLILFCYLTLGCSEMDLKRDTMENPDPEESEENITEELQTTILGKIIAGYQGWYNAPGDGQNLGWKHYLLNGEFEPGSCSIDYWPDMSEMTAAEKYATAFEHADGSVAHVFSSANATTVSRHFEWMEDYGIDGVFVQKFLS